MSAIVLALLLQAAAPAAALPDQVAPLQAQLDAARREIATLRQQVAQLAPAANALNVCEAKNRRLVGIGNELIAAFDRKYRRSRFGPFQLGRRKFEQSLQSFGDRVYENRGDATAIRPVLQSDTSIDAQADTKPKRE